MLVKPRSGTLTSSCCLVDARLDQLMRRGLVIPVERIAAKLKARIGMAIGQIALLDTQEFQVHCQSHSNQTFLAKKSELTIIN